MKLEVWEHLQLLSEFWEFESSKVPELDSTGPHQLWSHGLIIGFIPDPVQRITSALITSVAEIGTAQAMRVTSLVDRIIDLWFALKLTNRSKNGKFVRPF